MAASAAPAVASGAQTPALVLNDASGLNPTRVARHHIVTEAGDERIAVLRRLLKDAAAQDMPVVVGGARHSMGGQSLEAGASALTFRDRACRPDPDERAYRVSAGTRWRDVTAALDPADWSVAVMQSNNDFSVGGSISVNAHGWAAPRGPIGTTVRQLRVLLADGSLVTCGPGENGELFRLVVGGYGLFGIVVDADLDMVRNVMLAPAQALWPGSELGRRLREAVYYPGVRMAYGRLSVAASAFLTEGVVVTFREVDEPGPLPPTRGETLFTFLSGTLVRAQRGSEVGKRARWYAETVLAPKIAPRRLTRNRLLNQSVSSLSASGRARVDILHEYFVPVGRFADFLDACRSLIPRSHQDLLNMTLRYVETDTTSVLSFAPAPRIAAVLLFSQARTDGAETDMRSLTERLVAAVVALGGSFYLPYRLHATPEQVRAAYSRIDEFRDKKRVYDPGRRFRNVLFDRYFA